MKNSVKIEPTALARLFSSAVVKELAGKGRSPTLARLVRESGIMATQPQIPELSLLFERAFYYLKQTDKRHEYVYKAAITQKVLLGKHSLDNASMLTELRVGRCKADVVILNGTATAYEVKSERDKLSRLSSQVEAYLKVFATVNVIAAENHVDAVLRTVSDSVGVMKLSKALQISTVREGRNEPSRTCPAAIFDTLTVREAMLVLGDLGVVVGDVPNTQKYSLLQAEFVKLDSTAAHRAMVEVLKKSRTLTALKSFVGEIPESLHCVSLSTRLRKRDRETLVAALRTPMSEAMGWS